MAKSNRDSRSRESESDSKLMSASENLARMLGVIFIVVGFGLIIALVGGFVVSKLPYRVDPNLPIPTLDSISEYTNQDSLDLSGSALPGETVVLYKDGDRTGTTAETDADGEFTFKDTVLEDEGDVTFEAAVTRGGIFKRRSEFSNEVSAVVDWSPPSSVVSLEYEEETATGTTTVTGTAEPDTTVILEGDINTYEAETGGDGTFEVEVSDLEQGSNEFTIRVKDKAGNEVVASSMVTIAYASNGDLNGPGVAVGPDGKPLPESAGELEAALAFLAGNNLMLVFGLLALAAFGVSSTFAYRHSKK
jgi:hypothetical protein